jgi:low affinity Fe/Cu permease
MDLRPAVASLAAMTATALPDSAPPAKPGPPAKREGIFDRAADWVSFAMGRPNNIIFWLVIVLAWTFVFAFGGPHLSSGNWLPRWFTSTGYNFPLNLITTVAELFIGFLVAAAANRSEKALRAIINHILTETDEIDALLKENTDLTRQVQENTSRLNEIHAHLTAIGDKLGVPAEPSAPTAPTAKPK